MIFNAHALPPEASETFKPSLQAFAEFLKGKGITDQRLQSILHRAVLLHEEDLIDLGSRANKPEDIYALVELCFEKDHQRGLHQPVGGEAMAAPYNYEMS